MKRYLKQILSIFLIIVMAVPVLAYDGRSYCENCGETCYYTIEYEQWSKTYHCTGKNEHRQLKVVLRDT